MNPAVILWFGAAVRHALDAENARRRLDRARNPGKYRVYDRRKYLKGRDRQLKRQRERRRLFPLLYRERDRADAAKSRPRRIAYAREYYRKNRERHLASMRVWEKEKYATDPQFNLLTRLRRRVQLAFRDQRAASYKAGKTMDLVGCSPGHLRKHIESLFLPGMTWENRPLWHLDHIIPCSAFDLRDPQQQKQCFHYGNLQPLWAKDNLSKGGIRRTRKAT